MFPIHFRQLMMTILITLGWSVLLQGPSALAQMQNQPSRTHNETSNQEQGSTGSVQSGRSQPATAGKVRSKGDIDMTQFDDLQEKPKPADSGANIKVTCLTPQGTMIKKGEKGFDSCLANAQSPVLNQPLETEKENDPRKH